MFPTNQTPQKPKSTPADELASRCEASFETIEEFAAWLDSDLDSLVEQFASFETDSSVRNFFSR